MRAKLLINELFLWCPNAWHTFDPPLFSLMARISCTFGGCKSDILSLAVHVCLYVVTWYCSRVLCHAYLFLLFWHPCLPVSFFFIDTVSKAFCAVRHSNGYVAPCCLDWAKRQWPLAFEPGGLRGCVLLGLIFLEWPRNFVISGNLVSDCATVTACTYLALITYIYWCLPPSCILVRHHLLYAVDS